METKKLLYIVIVLQIASFFYLDYVISGNSKAIVKNQKIVFENEKRILANQVVIIEAITGQTPEFSTD